ncbi:histidine ammonia-lyase [Aureimonas sp. SA4125]|uniref:HAL/PAL/TAL family ammonia-lyase n=1 Tax=Aureimonas sp. SA4125 TaxID=2826993 RepID=UPI001CC6F87A|nr:histidine ammonia-lyase [Aureimonas sp. SA4125]BDA85265.1 histidine ammonia-lyase [Aureimonas sp. SA4125]
MIILDTGLDWRGIVRVAGGEELSLSAAAWQRLAAARDIVEAILDRGIRAYGVNTGVGALSDTVVDRESQRRFARNLLMSHACGVGAPLPSEEVRAIIAVQVNNFAHGRSGVRPATVEAMLGLLSGGVVPEVPGRGSVGYLTHMAHIGLVLIGEGFARIGDERMTGAGALARIGQAPVVLEAKEGLSMVNGSPCATGLAALALARAERVLDWADALAALSLEALGGQTSAFDEGVLAVRPSEGLQQVGRSLRMRLFGSGLIARALGARTQDALSLRAIPHVHGAARDVLAVTAAVVDRELAAVTDNPMVSGTAEDPRVHSEAHAVAPALGQALDSLGVAVAQVAAMAERRLDRLINPLVSGLPPFLALDPGSGSGFMIAQYTALGLVCENRRLAAPASLDGGVTSGLQEDFLAHATAASTKCLAIIDNAAMILGIEYLAGCDAHDALGDVAARAAGTEPVYAHLRAAIARYGDDRALSGEMTRAHDLIVAAPPPGHAPRQEGHDE